MTEEQPGYAERDDDEFTEPTGGGAEWEDPDQGDSESDEDDVDEDA